MSFMLTLNIFYTLFLCFFVNFEHVIADWTITSINAHSSNHKISFCAQSYQCKHQCGVTLFRAFIVNFEQIPYISRIFNFDFEYAFYLSGSCLVDSKGMTWKIFSYINVLLQKQHQRFSVKGVLQNSQENTCARVSF